MSGNEIREKINENNKIIAEQTLATFTLNQKAAEALRENKHLQDICDHEFDELGYCIYCDKMVD